MKKSTFIIVSAMGLTICLAYNCTSNKTQIAPLAQTAAAIYGVGCDSLEFLPKLPSDVGILNQQCANTFAWQSFIALTWPASPYEPGKPDTTKSIDQWGEPGDLTPTAFCTFKSVEEIFTNHKPDPWGSNQHGIMHEADDSVDCKRKISRIHKLNDKDVISELFQAGGGKTPWLTDQEGDLIWYEIKINQQEFEYITKNKFYNPKAQYDSCNKGHGIWLPYGAIEVKASWRIIPPQQFDSLKNRYKIIQACVPTSVVFEKNSSEPTLSDYREKKLGLVGLHIIQKTPTAPQLIWATFEHVDLAPVGASCNQDKSWLLYRPESCSLPSNRYPVAGIDSIITPIQVTKDSAAVPNREAQALNALVHERLKVLNPKSVFRYYNLVDSQWPSSAISDNDNGPYTPLADGGKTPYVLTNVSMETYVQKFSCLKCHVGAGAAKRAPKNKEFAADYSFIFEMAKPQN